MKNKAWKVLAAVLLLPFCMLAVFYLGISIYYQDTYTFQTYINGFYATGQTVEAMAECLSKPEQEYRIQITDFDGKTEEIQGDSIDIAFDYEKSLTEIKKQQKTLLWAFDRNHPSNYEAVGIPSFDKEKAIGEIKNLSVYREAAKEKHPDVKIVKGKEGYELLDETQNVIDPEKLVNVVLNAIEAGQTELLLSRCDCLKKYQKSREMLETEKLFEKIDQVQSTNIVYRKGEKEVSLSKSEIADFIAVDENGEFLLDSAGDLTVSENRIYEYTERLSEVFDTLGKDVDWEKESGGKVKVNNATFGCKVDREAEKEQIASSVLYGIHQEREPFFLPNEADVGTGEIGDTYIEVDMTKQMLYYYIDGVLYLETDVVTGATNRGRGTPEKVCYVYGKQKNRTLRGANYAAFVNYWMPVYGNIGLHDARWRKEFGGDIYKDSGSHGCINLPREAAEKIYDKVEIGTPVIMYY